MAVATNQRPMKSDTYFTGATLVTMESPTGERQSSPQVCTTYAATNQNGLTSAPPSLRWAPITMKMKPAPTSSMANAILMGVLGSRPRRASAVQSAAKKGAKIRMASEFTDWNQEAGNVKLPIRRSVRSAANRFIDEPACSNAIQKKITKKKM